MKIKDSGLSCLLAIANFNDIAVSVDQIKHSFALDNEPLKDLDILKITKEVGLKSKLFKTKYEKLPKLKLPLILKLKDESYIILGKFEGDKPLILDSLTGKTKLLTKDELIEIWDDKVILVVKKGSNLGDEIFSIKWFIPTIMKYKKNLYEILLAVLTIQIIGLITPIVMQVVIDKVLVHRSFSTLNVLVVGLLVSTIFETVLGISKTYVFTHTTSKIDVILGARLFKHLFSLPLRYFEVRRVGETIARIRELENIRRFLTGTPLTLVLDVAFIFIYLIVMFFYSTTLTWTLLATLPLFIILSIIVTPMFKTRLDEKFKYGAEMQSFLVESVSGIQTVKASALEPKFQRKWEDISAEYTKANFNTAILGGTASSIGKTIQKLSDLLILWLGAKLVIESQISVGQLIAFRMLSGRVSGPILRIVQLWQEFQQVRLSIKRLGDIFKVKPEPSLDLSKLQLPPITGKIEFHGVTFRYKSNMPEVLRDLTFEISSGKTVGIVGRSGSGKSTLSKLVQRLYAPENGKITIDGVDITLADPAWLRRQIGIVLQESFLFNGSIKENISINYPSATMDEIIEVAKIAGAHEFILEFPEAYDTMVGEKGSGLSGGQKQRIAIARSLITNPRILIFDEATSALDYESEKIIQENLSKICHGRTVLIIAHRLSTLRDADYIMALDRGKIMEYDTHENLMEKKGLYHYLYTQQSR